MWAASCKCSHLQLKLLKVFKGSPYLRNHPWKKRTFFSDIFDTLLPHVDRFLLLHTYISRRQIQGILFSLSKVSWILSRDMSYLVSSKARNSVFFEQSFLDIIKGYVLSCFINNEKTLLAKFKSDQTKVCWWSQTCLYATFF